MCKPDRINVIANSDIYFDATIHFANPSPAQVYALSRWDVNADGSASLWDHHDSQDCYIISGGPHMIDAHTVEMRQDITWETGDFMFTQGIAGCDNRLAHVLQRAGFIVTNPSRTIKSYHLHLCGFRSYVEGHDGRGRGGRKLWRIPQPHAYVKPTTL